MDPSIAGIAASIGVLFFGAVLIRAAFAATPHVTLRAPSEVIVLGAAAED